MKVTKIVAVLMAAGLYSVALASDGDSTANPPTSAVPGGDKAQHAERIEVTGSSIKRINGETASPLQIISRQQIEDQGANTLQEVLANLTQSAPALVDSQSAFSGTDGASQANLRGLGPQATLVLLNGRRLASYGAASGFQYQFVNIDDIPADAIERVEVLADGASAVYGSDAMAGVINVITKQNFQGGELHASTQESLRTHNNGEHQAGLIYGIGDLGKDGYNLFGTLSLYQRDAVYLPTLINDFPSQFYQVNPGFIAGFHATNGTQPGQFNPGSEFVYDASGAEHSVAPGCPTPYTSGTGVSCPVNSLVLGQFAIPSSKRENLFLSGRLNLAEGWQAFTELSGSHIDMYTQTPVTWGNFSSGGMSTWYARNTGSTLNTFEYPYLSATNPYNHLPPALQGTMNGIAGLQYTFLDSPNIFHNENTDENVRLVAGIRGSWRDWDVESALTLAHTHSVLYQDTNLSISGFNKAFGPITTDPATGLPLISNQSAYQFGVNNASNAALLQQISPDNAYPSWDRVYTWDGKISGAIGSLTGGDVQLASGVNVSYENYYVPGNPAAANGDIVWQGGSWFSGSRTTEAIYSEVLLPFTNKLEADVALRVDKYPAFNAHVVPKLGIKYNFTPEVLLRGTFSQGFRAPSLAESGTGGIYAQDVVNDPIRCQETNAIASVLMKSSNPADVTTGQNLLNSNCQTVTGGITSPNPKLKPETSNQATAGFVFQPSKHFDISADYFFIYRKNEIVAQSPTDVLNQQIQQYGPGLSGSPYANRLPITSGDRAVLAELAAMCQSPTNAGVCPSTLPTYTAGLVSGIINGYINRTQTLIDGFDINTHGRVGLGAYGKLDLGADATIKHRYRTTFVDGGWQVDNVGLYGTPKVTANLRADWTYGAYTLGVIANYVGHQSLWGGSMDTTFDYKDCVANPALTPAMCSRGVPANTYVNTNLDWNVTRQLKVDLNIQNIFNKLPTYDPVADLSYGLHGVNQSQNYEGRILKLGASYKF